MATTLLTVKEVAERLRLSTSAAYRLISQELPALKLGTGSRGGRKFVREEDLEAWIEANIKAPLSAKEDAWVPASKRAGERRRGSGTRGSSTRKAASASSDPQVAALESWLRRG